MCDPFTIAAGVATAGASIMQGVAGFQAGNANAAIAKAQGREARIASQIEAANLEARGTYQLGDMRRQLAGSGNVSALDFVAASATNLSLDIERVKRGGRAAQAQAGAQADLYRWQGRNALFGGLTGAAIGAGTQLLTGLNTGGTNPSVAGDQYGQLGRYGSGVKLTGSGGRLIGGI